MDEAQKKKVLTLLKRRFGLKALRPGQEEVIASVLHGHNTLAIMPTGAGKSLCYQLPALMLSGVTVVVSPLIALMKDQTQKLDQLDMDVVELDSSVPRAEQEEALHEAEDGEIDFVYTTPERLATSAFQSSLAGKKVSLLVIDEVHCLSQWGHDFRPAYLGIQAALENLGHPPVLAMTATATPQVIDDLREQLGVKDLKILNFGIQRENLYLSVVRLESEADRLDSLRQQIGPEPTIIYAATVKAVEEIYQRLRALGLDPRRYHARLSRRERSDNQDAFMSGRASLIIATNAFGLGIDKPDIRHVIHYHFPGSLEAYYQEAGRAGRDGDPARCTLLFLRQDRRVQAFFLAGRYPDQDDILQVHRQLAQAVADGPLRVSARSKLGEVPAKKTQVILRALEAEGWLAQDKHQRIVAVRPEMSEAQAQGLADRFRQKRDSDQSRLKQVIVYAQSALCRWKWMMNYFGQASDWKTCGHCDSCEHPIVVAGTRVAGETFTPLRRRSEDFVKSASPS